MKEHFFRIAFVIFILTIYCKVSNGEEMTSEEKKNIFRDMKSVSNDIDLLKKENEIRN